jgi:hypothetical protein
MVTVSCSLQEMRTWAGRVEWWEGMTLQHTAFYLTACTRIKHVKLCHQSSWCFTEYICEVADISTANTQRPSFPGINTITCHTFLVDIRLKIKNNISVGNRQEQTSVCG